MLLCAVSRISVVGRDNLVNAGEISGADSYDTRIDGGVDLLGVRLNARVQPKSGPGSIRIMVSRNELVTRVLIQQG